MISYAPFFKTLVRKDILESQLVEDHVVSSATIHRIQHGGGISTQTLDRLCKALNCRVGQIIEYVKDPE